MLSLALFTVGFGCNTGSSNNALVASSTDGKIQMTFPSDWKNVPNLSEIATLQYANNAETEFIIAFSELKSDFPVNFTLQQYSDTVRQNLKTVLNSVQESGPTTLTINGYSAIQYAIQGKLTSQNDLDITYIQTVIETTTGFHQILAWSESVQFGQSFLVFQNILNTFKALQP